MNGYLLDTHVLIWWLADKSQLSQASRAAITDPSVPLYLSVAAAWEMTIKRAAGKLDTPDDLPQVLHENSIAPLAVTLDHALAVGQLPRHHGDPFDRLMIAQARHENLTLISHDEQLRQYDVPILWA